MMSPVRKKPPTVFMKSRIRAREQLEEEQRTEQRRREEEREKHKNLRLQVEKEKEATSEEEVITQDQLEADKIDGGETLSGQVKTADTILVQEETGKDSTRINPQEDEEFLDSEDEASNSQLGTSTTRVKKPIWMAEEGYGRCGKGCEGCAAKCGQQGQKGMLGA